MSARPCSGCRYWSELLAEVRAGVVYAMCLHPERVCQWRPSWGGCDQFEEGRPVDLIDLDGEPVA